MTEDRSTDPASPVPQAEPLTGESAEPDHPSVAELFPVGEAGEGDHLVTDEDA